MRRFLIHTLCALIGVASLGSLQSCAPSSPRHASASSAETPQAGLATTTPETSPNSHRFASVTPTDRLLDAKPHALPAVKSNVGEASAPEVAAKPVSGSGGPWRVQVGALPDLEAAQARKRELDAKLGGNVDVTFEPPYYKLRWGSFATRQEAEDGLLEISEVIREGFVVRQ